ncbi:MAG: sulfatase-like hydrolase/transferase [Terriglobia bacterium]|jgi:arylsulfatase A-like enzyme/Tfp pilus assembly protein PilF
MSAPARHRAASIALLLLALAACNSRPPAISSPATGPSVLLITVDTLRADHLGCYGARDVKTPAIDSLAAHGIRFGDALSQVPLTLPSHAVILSGTYPMWNGLRDFDRLFRLRPDVHLIAEAFQRHGYETAAFVSAFVLDSLWGLNRGFNTYDDRFESLDVSSLKNKGDVRSASETVDHLLAWYRARDAGGKNPKPSFVWLHLYDPHTPYDPPEPFHTEYASHLYDGEIAYADQQLSYLFDYLRQNGAYDQTLIVLLSDHGESLGEHGEDEHGFFVYRSTIHVPLIIKLPVSQRASEAPPTVINAPVGTIDVAPTLLELARIQDPISLQFQGRSLGSLALGKSKPSNLPIYSESFYPRNPFGWSPLRSLSTARYQYIAAPRPELYDLVHDRAEKHNVQHSADAAAFRSQLLDIERRYTSSTSSSDTASTLSSETVEKLKSLGYVAFSAPVATTSEDNLPDPKDRLQTFKAFLRARSLASAGQFERANALLKSLRAQEPNLYVIPAELGHNAEAEKRLPEAENYYRETLKLNPAFEDGMLSMARLSTGAGKTDEARTWYELAISKNPQNYLLYRDLGQLEQSHHDLEDAKRNFEKAIALKPDYVAALKGLGTTLVELQRFDEALKPLEKAASLASDDPELNDALRTAYLNTTDPKKAIQPLRKALELKSK